MQTVKECCIQQKVFRSHTHRSTTWIEATFLTKDIEVFKKGRCLPQKITQYNKTQWLQIYIGVTTDYGLSTLAPKGLSLKWGRETGQDDYDLKIAGRLWKETVNRHTE